MARKSVLKIALAAAILILSPGLKGQEKSAGGAVGTRDGVIGPNDALNIFVPAAEEMTKTWRVNASGELNLPLIGTQKAAGKTVDEFERTLTAELKGFIRDPQVTVSIVDFRSQPVTIMGAVEKPGTLQLEGRKTLLDVLMSVGGPKDAGPSLTLTRNSDRGRIPLPQAREEDGGKYSVVTLNIDDVLAVSTPASNLIVEPRDVISVSPALKPVPRLVQVIGEVMKPGAVELVHHESVSMMQALAAAGGVTRTASLKKTVIMHVNPEGVRTEIAQIDLSKVMEGKVKDIELVGGDIVVIPTSQLKSYFDIVSRQVLGQSTMVLTRF